MRILNLALNIGQAARLPFLNVTKGVFGGRDSWRSRVNGLPTEYAAIYPPVHRAQLTTLAKALMPMPLTSSIEGEDTNARRRIKIRATSRVVPPTVPRPAGRRKRREERWFFVNGVSTDLRTATLNVEALGSLFGRPITLLHNDTEGLVLDLLECAVGKEWDYLSECVVQLFPPLLDALTDARSERVVLIAHSQGTIVAAVMLKILEEVLELHRQGRRDPPPHEAPTESQGFRHHVDSPERRVAQRIIDDWPSMRGAQDRRPWDDKHLSDDHIARLEVYCFANCASSMEPFAVSRNRRAVPWIESFANEYDLIARLGLLAPTHGLGSTRITGDRYYRRRTWGHLLNAHYLPGLAADLGLVQDGFRPPPPLQPFRGNAQRRPRLYEYAGGATPPRVDQL